MEVIGRWSWEGRNKHIITQRFLQVDQRIPITIPPIKVAAIPTMAMDRRDWFPVSFSSLLSDVGATVSVTVFAILVAVGLGVEVDSGSFAGPVGASVEVSLSLGAVVFVTVGVMEAVAVSRDVTDGRMVAGGVKVIKGAALRRIDKFILAVSLSDSSASARFNRERIGKA